MGGMKFGWNGMNRGYSDGLGLKQDVRTVFYIVKVANNMLPLLNVHDGRSTSLANVHYVPMFAVYRSDS